MKFENVHIFRLNVGYFKHGAAVTIPCIGIFVGKGLENDTDMLRHEFGHILQYRRWGFWMYWRYIAYDSLKSAQRTRKYIGNHQDTWTEWSANRLSYDYFQRPEDWNFRYYPIAPVSENSFSTPKFAANKDEFEQGWMDA